MFFVAEWNLADQVLACFCEIICSVKTVIRIWPDHQQTLSGKAISYFFYFW